MTEAEHIPSARIHVIPLAYDFRLYELPPTASVHALKDSTVGKLRLVDVCRLTRFKRPELLIALARQLADWNIPFRLTILGAGELEPALRQLVTNSRLEDYVELPGYVPHVLTYLAAADLFVHPSLLESSCISVKEAGLVNLPVVVCRGVGDFDDTLTDGIDAFLVDPDDFVAQAAQLVRRLQMDRQGFALVGEHLQQTIRSTFDIEVVAKAYEPFHQP
jgi:glycosyltransferase involved in cell wall biosynthesis